MMNGQENQVEEQFQTLLDAVERLRAANYPTLDAELVREVLQLHASGEAADADISRRIEQAVDRRLAKD